MQFAPSSHTSQTPAEWWSAKPWIEALQVSPAYELRSCASRRLIFFHLAAVLDTIYMHVASKLEPQCCPCPNHLKTDVNCFHCFNWAWGPSNRASKPCAISCRQQAHTCSSKSEAPNTQGFDPNRSSCSSSQGFLTSALMPTGGFCSSSNEKNT